MKTVQEYQKRLQHHLDELKWLYCELYPGREDMFTQLCEQMEAWYQERPESEKKLDREREQEPAWYSRQDMLGMMLYIDAFAGNLKGVKKKLPYLEACNVNYLHLMPFPTTAPGNFTWREECQKYVMTSFYPYQWDLNYSNPVVFNEMVYNMLYLVNQGIDIVRIDAVPYIWKQLGTDCRNLPQVHTIVRMIRMITEIVCPGVVLLGEVVMEPAKVVPYFGTLEKPECHMLYNVTTMASTWHTVATKEVALLKQQMDVVNSLPKEYVFLNYLRCHDDIGWGLDYDFLKPSGIQEIPHKKYLNEYFRGMAAGSDARGELYNDDPVLQDARLCGTTASLCGLEASLQAKDPARIERAIQKILMLNAYLFIQSGIPVIYSGDEIGQLNDYSYKDDPDADRAADSRYVHRGHFRWEMEKKRAEKGTVQNRIFEGMQKMEKARFACGPFSGKAAVWTYDTYNSHVLCICRQLKNEMVVGVFNFSDEPQTAWIDMGEMPFQDLLGKGECVLRNIILPGNGYGWYYKTWEE